MAEEAEGQDTAEASGAGVDPAAMALALGGAGRAEANAFLRRQMQRIDAQDAHIKEEQRLQLSHLRIRRFSDYSKMALELSIGLLILLIVAGVGIMVWNAAHTEGLIIESFSVPPDLASRGISGQMVASQILDKLTVMQNGTGSSRPAQSYANNWGDDIKVEIPDTGVSIGEVYRFLRGWLGHDTHITGEVYRTANGIAITARTNGDVGATYTGAEADFDALVQKAAEHVYGITQPYRYANYLFRAAGRIDEAHEVLARETSDPDPLEQAWAWMGLGVIADQFEGNDGEALSDQHKSIALNPEIPAPQYTLGTDELALGHTEGSLAAFHSLDQLLNRSTPPNIASQFVNPYRLYGRAHTAMLLGDYANAVLIARSGEAVPYTPNNIRPDSFRRIEGSSLARQHNGESVRAYLRELPPTQSRADNGLRTVTLFQMDAALENWQAVVASEPSVEKAFAEFDNGYDFHAWIGTQVRPFLALAKAKLGGTTGAEAVIATTTSDCYDCVRMRGNIAAIEGNWGRADYWFAKAVHDGPSIPFAETDWGQSMLARGKPDDAIAKFKLANQKGPQFADPLEGWGEALMAKNRSDLALAKFEGAEKYAPNWGRLHLKWGEALGYAGKKDEAQKQYVIAAGLDLSAADKAELAKVSVHG
jgi:tetratricopeptide (TPR) repeat protein